ncbi:MAG: ABC transporter permease [Lachnospiraceae bacterium]|nr:ABC transporter permease [Lachnospiraceae bacterium]
MTQFEMQIPGIEKNQIREIRLYRYFQSICVDKIVEADLDHYVTIEKDTVIFQNAACDLLRSNSKTLLFERIFFILVLLALLIFVWIIINAVEEHIDPKRRDNHGPIHEIKRFWGDMARYWQYMTFAASADLRAEVANSYLNRLWWLLEPLFSMLVYVVVFGRIMGRSVENYATYVFSALLMWTFFSKTINYSVKCVRNNRDIVTKVYVPKHVLLISNMLLNMYKLVFSLIILVPMLILFKVNIGLFVFWLIPAYILMILLSFGAGMILLHFGVYIDDLAYAVTILLQMMMFLSGIFYDVITSLPKPLNTMMLAVNPVSMFVDTMRNALLSNYISNVPLLAVWIVLSLELCYVGVHIVYKNENGYVKVV